MMEKKVITCDMCDKSQDEATKKEWTIIEVDRRKWYDICPSCAKRVETFIKEARE